jgi:hypothetical protein
VSLDAGADAGRDAGSDAGSNDAGADAGRDAGSDAGSNDGGAELPFSDGVCTVRPLDGGVYDPDCVYLIGTYAEGSAGLDVMVNLADAGDEVVGFGNYTSYPSVRPIDGRLLWHDFDIAYAFRPDPRTDAGGYPLTPLANDDVIATPCDAGFGVYRVWPFPDEAAVVYQCFNDDGRLYVQGSTAPVYGNDGGQLEGTGVGRTLLLSRNGALELVHAGVTTPVSGAGSFVYVAATRWFAGGFIAALWRSNSAPYSIDQVLIPPSGSAQVLAPYSIPSTFTQPLWDCVLDGAARLVCFSDRGTFLDTIERVSTDAGPEQIYDEAGQRVKIHISELATGP